MTASLEGRFALVTGTVIDAYAAKTFSWLTPEQIANMVVHAVLSPASANIDLIEIGPDGQF
jgi:NADP-dependent 3-hydroxy acid dehydrogenase YdfG